MLALNKLTTTPQTNLFINLTYKNMKLTNEQLKILVNDGSFFVSYMSYDLFGKLHEEALTVEEFFNLKKEKFLHLLNN